MSYQQIETAFQHVIATEPCWNIPTSLRMELIAAVNNLSQETLDDADKSATFYALLQDTLDLQPDSEMETRQLISLKSFMQKHAGLNSQSMSAILEDLCSLNITEPVAA